MTVSTESNLALFIGNGVAAEFDYAFRVLDAAHLRVDRLDAISGEFVSTYSPGEYTVAGVGSDAGSITLLAGPLSAAYHLRVTRIVPYTQGVDIVNQGGFYPEVVETQLDLTTMGLQQLGEKISRALLVPEGETSPVLPSAATRARQYLAFNDAGDAVAVAGTNTSAIDAADAEAAALVAQGHKEGAQAAQAGAEGAQAAAITAQGLAQTAATDAQAAANLSADYGDMPVYRTWALLSAATGMVANDMATVLTDTGTHTDPVVGGSVSNSGIFSYSASPAGWQRIANTSAADAAGWAEGTLPGGAGTKSAKGWAGDAAASAANAATTGVTLDGASPFNVIGSGASPLGAWGLTVPTGQTGNASILQAEVPLLGIVAWAGVKVQFVVVLTTSSNFDRVISGDIRVRLAGSLPDRTPDSQTVEVVSATRRILRIAYTIQAGDLSVYPGVRFGTSAAAVANQTAEITAVSMGIVSTPWPDVTAQDVVALWRERASTPSLGDVIELGAYAASSLNGATHTNSTRRVDLPTGVTGDNSLITYSWPLPDDWAGVTVDYVMDFEASNPFTPTFDDGVIQATVAGVLVNRTATGRVTYKTDGTTRQVIFRYPAQGDETAVRFDFKLNNAVPVAQDQNLIMTGFVPTVTSTSNGETVEEATARLQALLAQKTFMVAPLVARYSRPDLPIEQGSRIVTVSPGGGADFTSLNAAIASLSPGTVTEPWLVDVAWGDYYLTDELNIPAHTTVRGRGIDNTRVFFLQDNATSSANISAKSAFYIRANSAKVVGLTAEVENARYVMHWETGNVGAGFHWHARDLRMIHRGNPSPNNLWPLGDQAVLGCGNSAYVSMVVDGCYLESKHGPAYGMHTWQDFTGPSVTIVKNSTLIGGDQGVAAVLRSVGSGQADMVRIKDCVIHGDVVHRVIGWDTANPTYQPAQQYEMRLIASGNTPTIYRAEDDVLALRITSATTGAGSTVAISGTAAAALFGDTIQNLARIRNGSAGLPGRADSWGRVNGLITMGARLGDCSVTPKTLTVTVDSGAPINITFSTNMTAETNAAVMATINAALGSTATATVFAPDAEYNPTVTNEEQAMLNTSATAILRRSAVAYDSSQTSVRVMTSSDDGALFAGVALEDIPAGAVRRVKTSGWLPLNQISTAVTSLTFGATMSVGGTAGTVVVGGAQGILRAVRPDAVLIA